MTDKTPHCRQGHDFLGEHHDGNARKTWVVVILTTVMMVIEVAAGLIYGSMALLADGMHMATHAGAMLIAAAAYALARKHAANPRFTFGAGKFGDLAAFTSAVILAGTAAVIAWESVARLVAPVTIHYNEAFAVAVLGLVVNLGSAWLLRDEHHHHGHDHEDNHHDHGHAHEDLNLRAAYIHVAADALVSVLAIAGLLAGRQLGWAWMDPVMGLVGAVVIGKWAWGLLKEAGSVLLDMHPNGDLAHDVVERLEADGEVVCDLHLWRVGPGASALVATVQTAGPERAADFKKRLKGLKGLRHITIEVEHP